MRDLSIYTFLFQEKGNYYLFNTETLAKAKITLPLYENLSKGNFENIDAETVNVLEQKHIIVNEEDKYNFYNQMEIDTNIINYDTSTLTLFLIPTIGCNLQCPYCFEGNKPNLSMKEDTTNAIIEFINKSSAKKLSLHWYGGEPLTRFDLMQYIYNRICNETNLKITEHTIITNGYLIDDDVLSFFKQTNLNNIQITLDGKKELHNKKRFLKETKEGTFDKIIENIKKLNTFIPECNISVRVNIDKNNYTDFVDLYKYIHETCEIKSSIYVYPAIIKAYDENNLTLKNECLKNEDLFQVFDYYKKNGCSVEFFPKSHKHGCSACNVCTFTIGPNGEYYKCPEDANNPQNIIGYINDDQIKNKKLVVEYINQSSQFKRKNCRDCLCFPICSGGCGKDYLRIIYKKYKINCCHPLKNKIILKKAFLEEINCKNKNKDKKYIIDLF